MKAFLQTQDEKEKRNTDENEYMVKETEVALLFGASKQKFHLKMSI